MQSVKMLVVLSVITLISGMSLGGLYAATHELAENNILKFKKIPAVVDIYRTLGATLEGEQQAELEAQLLAEKRYVDIGAKDPLLMFVIKQGGALKGVAIEDYGQGFGGKLGVMAGFGLDDDSLLAVGVTTLSETPGLGTRVREPGFGAQFVGLGKDVVVKVKKDGGEIDAVSGATISSRAVTEAIRNARALYTEHRAAIVEAARTPPEAEVAE